MTKAHADFETTVTLEPAVLDKMMPMHLRFSDDGTILHAGPTIEKLHGAGALAGQALFDIITLRRSQNGNSVPELLASGGRRLGLVMNALPQMTLRGQCLPLPQGGGLLNLSLGLFFGEAIDARDLSMSDFSPCDQTVDLLYLKEAFRAVSLASQGLTNRLLAAEREAQEKASSDELTGLANRRAFAKFLDLSISRSDKPFALMIADLDRFKQINDELGHQVGDGVLQHVAVALKRVIRDHDLAARLGGDEFVLVIRDVSDPNILQGIAQRILEFLAEPAVIDGHEVEIGLSIGSTHTSHYARRDAERMLRDADEALYAAKRAGRGRHCHFDPMEGRTRIAP